MWVIGAGIMVGGFLSMVFAPMVLGLIAMGIGFLFFVAEYAEEKQIENKQNAWRKEYPSYKY